MFTPPHLDVIAKYKKDREKLLAGSSRFQGLFLLGTQPVSTTNQLLLDSVESYNGDSKHAEKETVKYWLVPFSFFMSITYHMLRVKCMGSAEQAGGNP